MNIPEINFPNLDPNFIEDPYPHLKTLRESSPLHKDLNSDLVLVTRFEDVKGVQTSKAFSSSEPEDSNTFKRSNESSENYPYFWKTEEFSLLNLEGQLHGDLRGLVAKAFSTRQVQELRPFMETKSEELLNNLRGNSFDLLADYAQPYSVSVIGKLLGVPEEQYDNFLDWSNKIVKMYDLEVSSESSEEAEQAAKDFYYYISELIDIKSKDPDDDMISRLSQVTENNQKLTKDQIICTVILLLNAGHEATVNTIGNSIVALNQNNISTKNLNTRYEIKKIIEELIRWDSPLQFFQRWVLEDTSLGGFDLKKNSKIAILLGSANRDELAFKNAEIINFERDNLSHTSFGGGVHFCLGAHLARLELEVSLTNLFKSEIFLVDKPVRTGAFGIRGYKEITVVC
ncbi:MAG: cytochrome P450 [Acidimicrobiaceae bacterium TMED244]|nr:MAG: cytochrome P450 [Acidimicrobiaceae bacterium TMED244]|tara:strand:+ start:9090 stop:10289 length:1200 start_codon:yes stop_codon:yes gene_type:complete